MCIRGNPDIRAVHAGIGDEVVPRILTKTYVAIGIDLGIGKASNDRFRENGIYLDTAAYDPSILPSTI